MKFNALNHMQKQYNALAQVTKEAERLIHLIDHKDFFSDLHPMIQSQLTVIKIRLKDVE